MLKKKYRLTGEEIKKIFGSKPKVFKNENFKVFYHKNNFSFSRFAFHPPEKIFKKAVIRNKIKRRIYNLLREDKFYEKIPGFDFVIFPQKQEILNLNYQELKNLINNLFFQKLLPRFLE